MLMMFSPCHADALFDYYADADAPLIIIAFIIIFTLLGYIIILRIE